MRRTDLNFPPGPCFPQLGRFGRPDDLTCIGPDTEPFVQVSSGDDRYRGPCCLFFLLSCPQRVFYFCYRIPLRNVFRWLKAETRALFHVCGRWTLGVVVV
jgi:hypothetical protein